MWQLSYVQQQLQPFFQWTLHEDIGEKYRTWIFPINQFFELCLLLFARKVFEWAMGLWMGLWEPKIGDKDRWEFNWYFMNTYACLFPKFGINQQNLFKYIYKERAWELKIRVYLKNLTWCGFVSSAICVIDHRSWCTNYSKLKPKIFWKYCLFIVDADRNLWNIWFNIEKSVSFISSTTF